MDLKLNINTFTLLLIKKKKTRTNIVKVPAVPNDPQCCFSHGKTFLFAGFSGMPTVVKPWRNSSFYCHLVWAFLPLDIILQMECRAAATFTFPLVLTEVNVSLVTLKSCQIPLCLLNTFMDACCIDGAYAGTEYRFPTLAVSQLSFSYNPFVV